MTMQDNTHDSTNAFAIWQRGLPTEIAFWTSWVSEAAIPWQEERRARLAPDTPLQPCARELIDAPPGAHVRLLDVGAGPATILGKTWPGRTVEIVAVDPLAEEYNRLLGKYGLVVPIRTQPAHGERLGETFLPDSFDLAYARNALDHSYDPVAAFHSMLQVVKPGCWVLLEHYVNEAEQEGYQGLHQWNFCLDGAEFVVWNRQRRITVREHLPLLGTTMRADVLPGEKAMLRVSLQRSARP